MKAPNSLMVLAVALITGGCAPLMTERPEDMDARQRLDRGLAALDAGAYPAAFDELTWVYSHCPGREAGIQALVALAALELDARNDMARPAVGTELLARVLGDSGTPHWVRPLAETTFLTARALGAPHPDESAEHDDHDEDDADRVVAPPPPAAANEQLEGIPTATEPATGSAYGCGASVGSDEWVRPALPTLPGPSMAALLTRAEARRDSMAVATEALQRELNVTREQLQATREELERIRKTLQP